MAKEIVTLPNGTTYEYDTDTGTGTLIKQGDPLIGGTNNPVPEDNSIYEQPPANPINIPAGTPVTDASKIDWRGVSEGDGLDDYAENYANVEPAGQTSYPYKKTTQDPPEEIPGMEGEDDFGGTSSLITSEDGSETGATSGLNADPKSVTKIGGSTDVSDGSSQRKNFTADLSAVTIDPRPNELNSFASYTYNIALYMLDSRKYVNLLTKPSSPQEVLSTSVLLMRSGGVGGDLNALERELGFFNDFFIDDLEFSSITVSPSKMAQNTNVTEIKFTITEPRGVTLLEKLRDAAAATMTTREKYVNAPYLLEIKFKGYDENGAPNQEVVKPRYVPIRITDINFEVTDSGTQYKVQAIPFASFVFGQIASTIPMNVELTAGTIGDIFNSGGNTLVTSTEDVRVNEYESGDLVGTSIQKKSVEKFGNSFKSLADVLTDYQKKRTQPTVKKTKKTPSNPGDKSGGYEEVTIPAEAESYDTYEFLIADEIANSKLNIGQLFDALNTTAPVGEKKNDGKANKSQFEAYAKGVAQSSGVSLDKEKQSFKINAGTDITKLLNLVIMHSDYMDRNVIENAEKGVTEGKGINWFKIKPVIKSATQAGGGFDGKDGRYKYHIVYVVEPSIIHYHDFPWAPKSKPKGNGVHKVYDYIYSGKNTQVLDFKLQFKAAYMQVMTAGTGSPYASKSPDDIISSQIKTQPQSPEGNTSNPADNLTRARAKDLFSSVMSDGVDMVELKMNIVGDPAYITTSDCYWQDKVRNGEQYTTAFMPDGTINYELSPPYVRVNLKTPVDYDEVTGLANPNTASNSTFSGVYQLTTIDSTFAGGLFQQRITGLRTPLQPTKDGVAVTGSADGKSGKERTAVVKDEENAKNNTEGTSNNPDQEFGGLGKTQATVVNSAASEDIDYGETPPYTSATVNNARTAEIARGPDQSVQTIPDVNADLSSSWTPPAQFLQSEPPAFTPTPPPVRVVTSDALEDQTVETI